ncbi:hypothetical protein AGOR_G00054050 [Albula goreensis]|uniref:Uncharacterized protein n=1 Tax=Albula goreensis TaxID=1534307 RepID=A0A8T3E2L9_9TELE|nr:hypothetical protein AGOR_G00054050 [Albula goreensis]
MTIMPLLKDNVAQVIKILLPAIADDKLQGIHEAADGALSSLVCHLDDALLLHQGPDSEWECQRTSDRDGCRYGERTVPKEAPDGGAEGPSIAVEAAGIFNQERPHHHLVPP